MVLVMTMALLILRHSISTTGNVPVRARALGIQGYVLFTIAH